MPQQFQNIVVSHKILNDNMKNMYYEQTDSKKYRDNIIPRPMYFNSVMEWTDS